MGEAAAVAVVVMEGGREGREGIGKEAEDEGLLGGERECLGSGEESGWREG